MGLLAHALRMAAEGAYERQTENPGQSVSRQAADLQMAALG